MNVIENENFPRGGKQITVAGERVKRKHEDNLFNVETQQKLKKSRKEKLLKRDSHTADLWQTSLKLRGTLSYNKMQDGMLILSCVRYISNLTLQVEFPGLTYGVVPINQISDVFTKKLSDQLKTNNEGSYASSLKEMIQVGQLMPAKIEHITNTEKGYEVHATLNPKDINFDKTHSMFKKGAVVWANVVSELDHGYELTLGVNNCRVFLPFKNVDNRTKYDIGQPLYCVIHKVDSSNMATTLTVSAKQEHISKSKPNDNLTLNDVLPGMRVEFVIEEITTHGIKGQFFENCFGYIDESQIYSKVVIEKLKEGTIISAYVLFIEPLTKVTYLTLRGLEKLPEPQLELGKITAAKVMSVVPRGLYLQLGKHCQGFVTNKRLLNTLPKEAQLDIIDAIRKKYPIGGHHDCRILDYNYMQQLYICTFEKQLIKEQVFGVKDLNLGQVVTVKIEGIVPNGLIVKAGHVQGFVPNIHLSNVKYSESIKLKFSVGMTVNARVLNISGEKNVIFTLKQGLIDSDKCLTKIENATSNSQHVGFVVQTKISGALIAFYGDVRGWITNKMLNVGNSGRYTDPRDYFFIGQVVTVWILGLKNDQLEVSLNPPSEEKKIQIKIGEVLSGTVTTIHSDGINVEVGPHKTETTIPIAHLSSNLLLSSILQTIYRPGQKMTNLTCINNTKRVPVVSRRAFAIRDRNSNKVLKLHELKRNMLLRCLVEATSDSGIYVYALIKDYCENIFIPNEHIVFNDGSLPKFEKQQSIVAKILNVNHDTKKVDLSVTCDSSFYKDNLLNSLVDTIEDIEYITHLHNDKNAKLTEYKIGSRVKCQIQKIDVNGDCFVSLCNGAEGIMPAHLKPTNCTVGLDLEGVVLDYNFFDNVVEISGKNIVNQKINKVQDGLINKSFHSSSIARIVLVTKFYALGVLNDNKCNRQLVYLPLCCKENVKSLYEDKMKIVICRRFKNKIVGLPKQFVLSFERNRNKREKRKHRSEKLINKVDEVSEEDDEVDNNTEAIDKIDSSQSIEKTKIEVAESNSTSSSFEEITDLEPVDARYFSNQILSNGSEILNKESVLSGARSFYVLDDGSKMNDESSSEDDEEEKNQTKHKKKLSPAERAEAAKKEEERIATIEKQLSNTTTAPQSAEQFDRLLLANPNSSELWLQYVSMHVAATELEKARAVGKRALETINITLVKEKFNIWIALLNLENMYGTKESFENLFEEAVRYNDSLDIYLSVIKMLAASGKLLEMEEKIKKLRSKEKQNTKMWFELGRVYYSLQKFKEARNIKEAAVKSILDKKRQFDIIVRFGIMEFQSGELEHAIANFETILDTYPTKVNIWIIYVDQLVKRQEILLARKALERCVGQKLGLKSMKILFQKFIHFEEQHGTPENLEVVKNRAKEYVTTLGVR